MGLLHYQTLEAVESGELELLRWIVSEHNARQSSRQRIKLWRKGDILSCLEPQEARWGFTEVQDEEQRWRVMKTLEKMSLAAPRLSWVIYEEGSGGELVLRGGELVA
jgi:hypothetical protein